MLFSPTAAPSAITKTHTTSTERTPRTAALSHLSDFGSLDTAARSDDQDDENITEHGSEPDDEAELDSLDDGLHHTANELGGVRIGRAFFCGFPQVSVEILGVVR